MRIKDKLQQEQGFTLIELMAVLAILTMLVLIAVPAIGSITKKAEAQADDATISMIEKAGGLALLGDVVYDDPDEEQYDVATLVEEGYLDIDESHKYAGDGNTVTHTKGYEFEFEAGSEPTEPTLPESEPDVEPVLSSVAIDNVEGLRESSLWLSYGDRAMKTKNYIELSPGTYEFTFPRYGNVRVYNAMDGSEVPDAVVSHSTIPLVVVFNVNPGEVVHFNVSNSGTYTNPHPNWVGLKKLD